MKGSRNGANGSSGLYPDVAEDYWRAAIGSQKAQARSFYPRELQSITWEGIRGVWSKREKMAKSNAKKGFTSPTDATNAVWQRYKNGEITMQDAHSAILGPNGEFDQAAALV